MLTKQQESEDNPLKCGHVGLEEAVKPGVALAGVVDGSVLVVCDSRVNLERGVAEVGLVRAGVKSFKKRLGRIMKQLYDLEPRNEPEKPLNVDLDLYQMENF